MLRLSRSNPRKKYEIDIKCDCEDPEKSGECMNDMTEATSQFQAAEREQTEPTKPHRCAEPGFYRRYSAREIRSSRYKKGSRPASAHAQCQEHGQLRALPSRRVPRRRAQKRRERILDNRKHDGVPRNGTLRRIDAIVRS